MQHRYIFTLEIVPLEVGKAYDALPSHLTLMSRFWTDLSATELAQAAQPIFADTAPLEITFGQTEPLGPQQLMVHKVHAPAEQALHMQLLDALQRKGVEFEYPQFVGNNHIAHVTQRKGITFEPGDTLTISKAYLVEIIDHKRVVQVSFDLRNY